MFRATLKPHTVRVDGKLRLLNGMANSAVHLVGRVVRTSQMASQSVFSWPFATRPSTSAPDGLVAK